MIEFALTMASCLPISRIEFWARLELELDLGGRDSGRTGDLICSDERVIVIERGCWGRLASLARVIGSSVVAGWAKGLRFLGDIPWPGYESC